MLELAIVGTLALGGYLFSSYRVRYDQALGKAADFVRAGNLVAARRVLKRSMWIPPAPGEVDRWALCANLLAFVERGAGNEVNSDSLIERVLERRSVSRPVRGLIFYRIAERKEAAGRGSEAAACRQQAMELFESGYRELKDVDKPLALYFYAAGLFREAADCLNRLLQAEWSAPLLYLRSVCLVFGGAPLPEILSSCQEALRYETDPMRRAVLFRYRGAAEQDRGNLANAIEALRESLSATEEVAAEQGLNLSAHVLSSLVRLYRATGQDELAWRARERLVERLDSRLSPHLNLLIGILHDEGEFEECRRLLDTAGASLDLDFAHGIIRLELGDPVSAFPYLERCAQEAKYWEAKPHPGYLASLSLLGQFRREEAQECLQAFTDPRSHNEVLAGWYYLWDGNPAKAQEFAPPGTSSQLFYEGRFEEYLQRHDGIWQTGLHAYKSPAYRNALSSYYRAGALSFMERWGEALPYYEEARLGFTGDAVKRDTAHLWVLVCQAHLGKDVVTELVETRALIEQRYPNSKEVQADADSALAEGYMALEAWDKAMRLLDQTVAVERRAFNKAHMLNARSICALALGSYTSAEDLEILRILPGSYLVEKARARLAAPS